MEVADQHADGRLIALLEGGYDLNALAQSAATHLHELSGSSAAEKAAEKGSVPF